MKSAKQRLLALQYALEKRMDICSTEGRLDAFPSQLMSPFLIDYQGVIICHEGSFCFYVNGEENRVKAGETLFLTDNVTFRIGEHTEQVNYSLLFYRIAPIAEMLGNTVMLVRMYAMLNPSLYILKRTGEEYAIADYIQLLPCSLTKEKTVYDGHERKLLMLGITYRMCSIFSRKIAKGLETPGHRTDLFVKLITLISEHYQEQRSVTYYANAMCLTPKYMSALVKEICGYSVLELIFRAVVRRAIFLMTSTDMTVQEISYELSFPNASAFGTFFKKHTGLSPKNYRNKHAHHS